MKTLGLSILALCLLGAITGCGGNKEDKLVGKWQTTGSTGNSVVMEFTKDKKFKLGGTFPIEGDWTLTDSTVSMRIKSMAGKSIDEIKKVAAGALKGAKGQAALDEMDKPITATISADGKTLTTVPQKPEKYAAPNN